jgi:hypothetical protein
MRRLLLFCAALVGGCFVGTLDLTGFACDTGSHPCTSDYSCVIPAGASVGTCLPQAASTGGTTGGGAAGGTSGGSSGGTTGGSACGAAPTCAIGGGLLLCDGGVQPCGKGLACDYGKCVTGCSPTQTCDAGAVCDTSVDACLPANACATDGGGCANGELCLAAVCTPAPPVGGTVGSCNSPGDGGMVVVEGPVAIFPDVNGDPALEDGGTVTFFNGSQTLPVVPIVAASGGAPYPSYSITVPVGTWTALVQQPGVLVPTYFPGLEVRGSEFGTTAELSLESVVELNQLPQIADVTPQPGHIFWVGRGTSCSGGGSLNYLAGFTVGFSPVPPDLGYLGDQFQVVPGDTASTSPPGEFFAEDAPYATTQYTMALNGGAGTTVLMSGTFVPPPYVPGQDIAVALVYPNFTQ